MFCIFVVKKNVKSILKWTCFSQIYPPEIDGTLSYIGRLLICRDAIYDGLGASSEFYFDADNVLLFFFFNQGICIGFHD